MSPSNKPLRSRGGVEVYLYSIFNLNARLGWVVNVTPRLFYHRERPGTHRIGGWVGPRAGLDGCRESRPTGKRSPDRPARSRYTDWTIPAHIHNYIHKTNRVSRLYSVAAVLYLQSVLHVMLFRMLHMFCGDRGSTVVKVLCYKSIGRWFDPSFVSLEFFIAIKSLRSHYGPGVDSASNRNEYQEHFLRVKAAGA